MKELPAAKGATNGPVAETTRVEVWNPYYGEFFRLPDIRITDVSPS